MNKLFTPLKVFFLTGFLVLAFVTFMNLTARVDFISIIPHTKYVEAILNGSCAILCLILFFNPELAILEYIVFGIEATICPLIGFTGIGCILLLFFVITLFIDGFFRTHRRAKITVMIIWWEAVLIGQGLAWGIKFTIFGFILTFFTGAMFFAIYDKFKVRLEGFIRQDPNTSSVNLPKPGSILILHSYALTDRQINFLISAIQDNMSYEEISQKNNISVSVVKKEMIACCQVFGVKNKESLKVLLIPYKLTP